MRWLPLERRKDVQRLLQHAEELELSADAALRLQWFAFAIDHDGNIGLTCRHFGISRSTFFRWAKRFDPLHPETLEEHSRRPHTFREPETDAQTIALIRRYREEHPLMGKEKIQKHLLEEHGVTVSVSTVGRVIARHGFFFADIPSHRAKRADAQERRSERLAPLEIQHALTDRVGREIAAGAAKADAAETPVNNPDAAAVTPQPQPKPQSESASDSYFGA